MNLPDSHKFLANEPGPLILKEALKLYGVKEAAGSANNPVIIKWADEVAAKVKTVYAKWADAWYDKDSIAWCGLFMAVVACRASQDRPERFPPEKYLSAAEWANFGRPIAKDGAMLGDVLVFTRDGGGHVGLYVGEDSANFYVLGGNQSDQVNIMKLAKSRLTHVRRSIYTVQPANVRKLYITANGIKQSVNEA